MKIIWFWWGEVIIWYLYTKKPQRKICANLKDLEIVKNDYYTEIIVIIIAIDIFITK